jgi:hypothetical protein
MRFPPSPLRYGSGKLQTAGSCLIQIGDLSSDRLRSPRLQGSGFRDGLTAKPRPKSRLFSPGCGQFCRLNGARVQLRHEQPRRAYIPGSVGSPSLCPRDRARERLAGGCSELDDVGAVVLGPEDHDVVFARHCHRHFFPNLLPPCSLPVWRASMACASIIASFIALAP